MCHALFQVLWGPLLRPPLCGACSWMGKSKHCLTPSSAKAKSLHPATGAMADIWGVNSKSLTLSLLLASTPQYFTSPKSLSKIFRESSDFFNTAEFFSHGSGRAWVGRMPVLGKILENKEAHPTCPSLSPFHKPKLRKTWFGTQMSARIKQEENVFVFSLSHRELLGVEKNYDREKEGRH